MLKNTYNCKEEKNFDCFQEAMTDLRINEAEKMIESTGVSVQAIKSLVLDLAQDAKRSKSVAQKNSFADMVEAWSINLNQAVWHKELIEFCRLHSNIRAAYAVKHDKNDEFVIVMDDSTDDSVLDYNEFSFELRDKYKEIHDFMVVDPTIFGGMEDMFEKTDKIYERRTDSAEGI